MKQGLMKVEKSETSVEIDIWLNPKYQNNGCLVAKSEQEQVKRLEREFVHYKLLVVEMGCS